MVTIPGKHSATGHHLLGFLVADAGPVDPRHRFRELFSRNELEIMKPRVFQKLEKLENTWSVWCWYHLLSFGIHVFHGFPRSAKEQSSFPTSWIWLVILLNFCASPPNAWGKISRGEAFFRQVDPSTSRVTQALQRCLAGSNWWDTDGFLVPKGRAGRGKCRGTHVFSSHETCGFPWLFCSKMM